MSVTVVVDVPVIEAKGATSALATCNAALGPEQCALAGNGESARWYATVHLDAEQAAVFRIELHESGPNGVEVASSQLEFKERDSPEERWASAGVVVAALVVAQRDAVPAPAPKPRAPAPERKPVRAPLPPARRFVPRLELGVTGGSESSRGTLRGGPTARFGIALSDLPVFALGSLAYTVHSSSTPDIVWLTGSLGFGVRVGFAAQHVALEVRTEAVVESLSFSATERSRTASAQRTRWGPRFGLDLSARVSDRWGLVLGAEAAALRPSVVIDVRGSTVDRLPPFSWGFISALRYDFR